MREWRQGFGADDQGRTAAAVVEPVRGPSAEPEPVSGRRIPVVEFLCIQLYWQVGKQKHDWLFVEGDRN